MPPQTVYVDVLVGLNLFVNYFLLLATARLTHMPFKGGRGLLAAFALALTSLVALAPTLPPLASLAFRLITAAMGVVLAFRFPGGLPFLRLCGAFFAVSFAFGGIALAVQTLLRPPGLYVHNGAVYVALSPLLLVVSTVAAYLLVLALRRYFGPEPPYEKPVALHLQQGERTVTVLAKFDSGFTLCDIYDAHPVLLLSSAAAERLLLPEETTYRLLPYETVNGGGFFRSALCRDCRAEWKGRAVSVSPLVTAVCPRPLPPPVEALFGREFLERLELGYEASSDCPLLPPAAAAAARRPHRLHTRLRRAAAALKKGAGKGAH